jgi:hypothetical protein
MASAAVNYSAVFRHRQARSLAAVIVPRITDAAIVPRTTPGDFGFFPGSRDEHNRISTVYQNPGNAYQARD